MAMYEERRDTCVYAYVRVYIGEARRPPGEGRRGREFSDARSAATDSRILYAPSGYLATQLIFAYAARYVYFYLLFSTSWLKMFASLRCVVFFSTIIL